MADFWRKCSTCKKPIAFNKKYFVCSVSSCNRQRTGLVFCKVLCFDGHLPIMRHRDAGAIEKTSPSQAQWSAEQTAAASKASPSKPSSKTTTPKSSSSTGSEILVVVSKVKAYIKSKHGLNTSEGVMRVLTTAVTMFSNDAIKNAQRHGRKTVLDRDFTL